MNYTDLHCDTPYELYVRGEKLKSASTDVDMNKLSGINKHLQLAAYCAPEGKTDGEAYKMFFEVCRYFKKEAAECAVPICIDADGINTALADFSRAFILTVEDARILEGEAERLDVLYEHGVRALTPLWGGVTCIGGSHQSEEGLSSFGKLAVRRASQLGMVLDVSHASAKSADDIIEICAELGTSVMASHSCAFGINPHSRNLRDSHARRIAASGGVIGVNLYPPHLTGKSASLSDAVLHIKYFINLAGEDAVALGCDFDGMGIYPRDVKDVTATEILFGTMRSSGMSSHLCEKVLFTNAYDFLTRSL